MKIKKDRQKFCKEIFINNSNNDIKTKINIFLNDKNRNRNNNLISKNNFTEKSYFLSRFRNDRKNKKKYKNLTSATNRNTHWANNIKMKTTELV